MYQTHILNILAFLSCNQIISSNIFVKPWKFTELNEHSILYYYKYFLKSVEQFRVLFKILKPITRTIINHKFSLYSKNQV